jgi:hypothetical protein
MGMIVNHRLSIHRLDHPTYFSKPPRGRREEPVENLRRRARSSVVRPRTTAQNHLICGDWGV